MGDLKLVIIWGGLIVGFSWGDYTSNRHLIWSPHQGAKAPGGASHRKKNQKNHHKSGNRTTESRPRKFSCSVGVDRRGMLPEPQPGAALFSAGIAGVLFQMLWATMATELNAVTLMEESSLFSSLFARVYVKGSLCIHIEQDRYDTPMNCQWCNVLTADIHTWQFIYIP